METPIVASPERTNRIFDLRPMNIGDLLDRTIFFYRNHFAPIVIYSLILNLPVTLFLFFSSTVTALPLIAPDMLADNPALLLSSNLIVLAGSLGVSVLSSFTTAFQVAGIAVAVRDFLLEGKRSSIRDMWDAVRQQLMPLFLMVIIQFVFTLLVGLGCLILFFTVVGTPFSLAILTLFSFASILAYSVLMYEGGESMESLRRGWLLITAGGRRVLAFFLVYYLFSLVIGGLLGGLLVLVGGVGTGLTENPIFLIVIQPIANLLVLVIISPLLYAVLSMLYFDLRIRTEGLDVALMSNAAAGQPLNLATAPVTQETVFGDGPRRAVLTLAGIFTIVIVVVVVLIAGVVIFFGALF